MCVYVPLARLTGVCAGDLFCLFFCISKVCSALRSKGPFPTSDSVVGSVKLNEADQRNRVSSMNAFLVARLSPMVNRGLKPHPFPDKLSNNLPSMWHCINWFDSRCYLSSSVKVHQCLF